MLLLFAEALALTACRPTPAGEVVRYSADKRVAAPQLNGELLTGGSFKLSAGHGKVIVINFWASYCAPCRVEADDLEAVHQDLLDIEFIGVNVRDDHDKALAFAEGRSSYPHIFDPAGRIALAFTAVRPNVIPATVIVDSTGRIAIVIQRAVQRDDLRSMIAEVASGGQQS